MPLLGRGWEAWTSHGSSAALPVLPRESPVALSGNVCELPCFAASVPFSSLSLTSWLVFSCNCLQNKPLAPKSLSCCPLVGKPVQNNHYSNEFIRLFIKPWLGACSEQAAENHVRPLPGGTQTLSSRQMLNKQTDTERLVFSGCTSVSCWK